MILDETLVLIEEKPAKNIFGKEICVIDRLLQGPIVDFMYKKDENTWAMSWYDFNLHLKNIPNCGNYLQKLKIYEYFYSGPSAGKKVEVIFPRLGIIGFLGLHTENGGIMISKVSTEWFDEKQAGGIIQFDKIFTKDGTKPEGTMGRNFKLPSPNDGNLVLRRYINVLSEYEKENVWMGSKYSIDLGIETWKEFKELDYDM